MNLPQAIGCYVMLFVAASVSIAQTNIDLTGTVLTRAGKGANGLTVKLLSAGVSDTTRADGTFRLHAQVTGTLYAAEHGVVSSEKNGAIMINAGTVTKNGAVNGSGVLFDLRGRSVHDAAPVNAAGRNPVAAGAFMKISAINAGGRTCRLALAAAAVDTAVVMYRQTVLAKKEVPSYTGSLGTIRLTDSIPVSHGILVSDPMGNKVCILDARGSVSRTFAATQVIDVWQLRNGNILFNDIAGVREIAANTGVVVWEFPIAPHTSSWSVQPLPDSTCVIAVAGPPEILIVNRAKKVLRTIPLYNFFPSSEHQQVRQVRRTPKGTYYACFFYSNVVQEVDSTGKMLWSYTIANPHKAVPLPNGNKLISTGQSRIIELNPRDSIVWELKTTDFPAGFFKNVDSYWDHAQRAKNGNTLFSNPRGNPAVIEVSPQKEVLWSLPSITGMTGLFEFHVMNENNFDLVWPLK